MRKTLKVSAPTGLLFSSITTAGMILDWSNAFDSVVVRKQGSVPTDIADGTEVYRGTDHYFIDSGLSSNTDYCYSIWVYNGTAYSSSYISGCEETLFVAPPGVLSTINVLYNKLDLAWVKAGDSTHTIIRRQLDIAPTDRSQGVEIYNGTGSTFTDTGLTHNTTYCYTAWGYESGTDTFSDTSISSCITTPLWLEGFFKRKKMNIANNSGNALSNYQMAITVAYDSDMQIDFDDIRFTAGDKISNLSYWMESKTDSSTAKFWVRVPSIPTTGTSIYLYYANPTVSTISNFNIFTAITDWNSVSWRKVQHSTCPWNVGWQNFGYNDSTWTVSNNPNFISACEYCDVYARLRFMLPSAVTGSFSVSTDDRQAVYVNGATIYDGGCRISACESRSYSPSFVKGENLLALRGSDYTVGEYLGISSISISGVATRAYSAIEPTITSTESEEGGFWSVGTIKQMVLSPGIFPSIYQDF